MDVIITIVNLITAIISLATAILLYKLTKKDKGD